MARVNIGDWVYYVGVYEALEGAMGYVEKIDGGECSVIFTVDPKGKPIFMRKHLPISYVIPATNTQPLTEQSFEVLMDLALATRDFEWCRQLTEQYKRVTKAGV
ncbi:hypothetical protein H839_16073 [Parageobacillus genomosp. 1]|uniref:IDEAL domain-containing protein n=1 Tax=Parageobacillus genomosp. 1 TaxID=1295642 RepID=A0ABC9VAA6_9BACL|nr:hypothetical protein [Parageobacillus genomosp. 1]EZP75033.1 hypothetical protein H839_16073 [Parageobacillus genomosp. 1]